MRRRTFLSNSLAVGGQIALTVPLGASAAPTQGVDQRWTLGYEGVDRDRYSAEVGIEGRWPDELSGAFYRNGPAQHTIGSYRYEHWFDGDGLVQRFQRQGNKLAHRAALVETKKLKTERELGRAALPAFGSLPPNGVGVTHADDMNPANISVLAHHDRFYALWEAGSAYELDPETLETVGPRTFSEETAGLPFSAHPRIDEQGHLWNFGYANGHLLVLWHLDPTGAVKAVNAIDVDATGMPHDFVITEQYLVILLAPLHRNPEADPDQSDFLGLHRWYDDRPTRAVLIHKHDLSLARTVDLPAQWIFHYGNAYEDSKGVVHFDAASSASPEILLKTFRGVMQGSWTESPDSTWTHYTIDPKTGAATQTAGLDPSLSTEFPRIDPRLTGQRHDELWLLGGNGHGPGSLSQVLHFNRRSDQLERFDYGSGYLVEEHLFVPSQEQSHKGWLLGTALNLASGKTELSVFNAHAVNDGPVARAVLPYAMPLGFHGTYRT